MRLISNGGHVDKEDFGFRKELRKDTFRRINQIIIISFLYKKIQTDEK